MAFIETLSNLRKELQTGDEAYADEGGGKEQKTQDTDRLYGSAVDFCDKTVTLGGDMESLEFALVYCARDEIHSTWKCGRTRLISFRSLSSNARDLRCKHSSIVFCNRMALIAGLDLFAFSGRIVLSNSPPSIRM